MIIIIMIHFGMIMTITGIMVIDHIIRVGVSVLVGDILHSTMAMVIHITIIIIMILGIIHIIIIPIGMVITIIMIIIHHIIIQETGIQPIAVSTDDRDIPHISRIETDREA